MKKLLSILLALAMVMSLSATALASGEASGESSAEEDTGPKAALVFTDDGEDTENEQTDGFALTYFTGGKKADGGISGFLFTSESSDAAFYFAELSEDTGAFYTIGGTGANIAPADYDVSPEAVDFLKSVGVDGFDSAIVLGDAQLAETCKPVISAKGYSYLTIEGALLLADGAARSAFYSDVVGGSTVPGPGMGMSSGVQEPVVIVRRSLLETTGGGKVDSEITVTSSGGRARGIQPQGKSITYLYDSTIVSHTWGAWSTDSARNCLDLVAWRSLGQSQGGYGAYADTNCRLFLYGSTVMGSSDGIVASNDGEIYAAASDSDQNSTELRAVMEKTGAPRDVSWKDYADDASGEMMDSTIMGGQTAVQFHMPDQGHSGAGNKRTGTLYMDGGALVTDESLISGGVDGLTAYNRHYAGACIVTKSTQANMLLDGTTMDSWNGVLVHTMINSDPNVNNIADGDVAPGSNITFRRMDVSGDIIHDDYQRELRLVLDGTTLTGGIFSNTCEDWNALCEAEFDGEYILNPDGYDTVWGVSVTLCDGAVWNVTEVSVVSELIINDGCTVNGVITENANGTLTVSPLSSGEAS